MGNEIGWRFVIEPIKPGLSIARDMETLATYSGTLGRCQMWCEEQVEARAA